MRSASLSIVFLVQISLAVTTFPEFPPKQAKECSVRAQSAGVIVGLEPVEESKDQIMYFGTNLAKKKVVPVFLVIENRLSAGSLIFDKSKVTFGATTSSLSAPQTGSMGKALALGVIPFIGGFAAAQNISEVSQIQTNLSKKEIRSTTISPGSSARGFLYVPFHAKSPRETIVLRIPLAKAGSDELSDLDLSF